MADIITRTFFAYGIEHFSAWGDFFQQQAHCGKIKINVHNDDFFGESEIHHLPGGEMVIAIRTTPGVIEKCEHSAAVFGIVYSDAPLRCTLDGREIAVRSKECVLINGGLPFILDSAVPRATVSVLLPVASFGSHAQAVTPMFDGRLASTLPFGKLINKLAAECHCVAALQEKVAALANLLIISCGMSLGRTLNKFAYLSSLIDEHCTGCDFSLEGLVSVSGMSKRSIQYVFAQQNTRFQDVLIQARLDRLLREMQHNPSRSLSDLVSGCGYRSLLTASRNFRRYYRESLEGYYIKYCL
ncbi:helix-turn-helix domain-containing protein [Edwardsiella piscicida]|uniref:helix-turn-helix domain-containing protein n=1 Tax=Edwardsiella piscicida TaxID=1263550 RepID=UPI00290BD583|nr:helix-turn-helix domain-containing protein [Edwardsiella piscicida]